MKWWSPVESSWSSGTRCPWSDTNLVRVSPWQQVLGFKPSVASCLGLPNTQDLALAPSKTRLLRQRPPQTLTSAPELWLDGGWRGTSWQHGLPDSLQSLAGRTAAPQGSPRTGRDRMEGRGCLLAGSKHPLSLPVVQPRSHLPFPYRASSSCCLCRCVGSHQFLLWLQWRLCLWLSCIGTWRLVLVANFLPLPGILQAAPNLLQIKKQRDYFAHKGPSSQGRELDPPACPLPLPTCFLLVRMSHQVPAVLPWPSFSNPPLLFHPHHPNHSRDTKPFLIWMFLSFFLTWNPFHLHHQAHLPETLIRATSSP